MYTGIQFTNNASTQLTKAVSATDTELLVANNAAAIFPKLSNAGDYFVLTIADVDKRVEIVKCTSRTDSSFTVERAYENTVAKAYNAGALLELRLTAGSIVNISEDASITKPHTSTTGADIGIAGANTYSHAKLSDDFESGYQAISGVACSPFAFQQAVNRLINLAKITLLTESQNWVVPETATYTITCVGGGGHGGKGGDGFAQSGQYPCTIGGGAGGGGGAGQTITQQIPLTKGTIIPVIIGGSSGTTTFGNSMSALGGTAGNAGTKGYQSVGYTQVCGYNGDNYECVAQEYPTYTVGKGGTAGFSYGSAATAGNDGSLGSGWSTGFGGKSPGVGGISVEGTFGSGGNGGNGGDGHMAYLDAQNTWATQGDYGSNGTQGCVKITVKMS